jgi:hypothetical protein
MGANYAASHEILLKNKMKILRTDSLANEVGCTQELSAQTPQVGRTLNRHASLANINYDIASANSTPVPNTSVEFGRETAISTPNNVKGSYDIQTAYSTPLSERYQLEHLSTRTETTQPVFTTKIENLKYSSIKSQSDNYSIYRQKSMPVLLDRPCNAELPLRKASLHSLRDQRMSKYTLQSTQ